MAESRVPDLLTLSHHRDLEGREGRPITRWILLGLLTLFLVFGLANAYGQQPETHIADGPVAELRVYSPTKVRSGLLFESRFTIRAHEEIENATLVLDPGWLEGMTLNTLTPGPVGEASRNGRIALELGHIPAGGLHRFFLHFQVNPTNVAFGRAQDVELHDGERLLAHIDRTITVYP